MTTPAPVFTSPQEALAATEAKVAALQEVIQNKVLNGEDFGVDAVAYAAAITENRTAFVAANQEELEGEKVKLGQTIFALVDNSPMATLMAEPVTSVYLSITPGTGENGPVMTIAINPKNIKAPSIKAPSADGTGSSRGRKTPSFRVDGGEVISGKDFVNTYGPPEVLGNSLVAPDAEGQQKWPTKPVFLAATEKHLVELGHTVERVEA